jgi:hypothetical protein
VTVFFAFALFPYMDTAAPGNCSQQRRFSRSIFAHKKGDGPFKFKESGLLENFPVERVIIIRRESMGEQVEGPDMHAGGTFPDTGYIPFIPNVLHQATADAPIPGGPVIFLCSTGIKYPDSCHFIYNTPYYLIRRIFMGRNILVVEDDEVIQQVLE